MELQVKPHTDSSFPLAGILIRGSRVEEWLRLLDTPGLRQQGLEVFPIPGTVANSVWGCFAWWKGATPLTADGPLIYCQHVFDRLFIPANTILYPHVGPAELEPLFPQHRCVFHPEFGWAELEQPVDWRTLIDVPEQRELDIRRPVRGIALPETVRRMEIWALPPEEMMQDMEEHLFPQQEEQPDKPLTLIEKIKLFLLRPFFRTAASGTLVNPTGGLSGWIDRLFPLAGGGSRTGKLQQDYRELERRNQNELDRLLDMLRKDPAEALKYAIPLNESGTSRGGYQQGGGFSMTQRWSSFSLFGNRGFGSGSGSTIMADDAYSRLRRQYTETAEELIRQGAYEKAAFIYLKLLQNHHQAAQTLEQGRLYGEAASVYLKYAGNKEKAAECYESGNMLTQAIDLYKELGRNEKVGDLYMQLNDRPSAMAHYRIVVEGHREEHRYLRAATMCREKMDDAETAQSLLLDGWRQGRDATSCLNEYFDHAGTDRKVAEEVDNIYYNDIGRENHEAFLMSMKHLRRMRPGLADRSRDIAYEIISAYVKVNPTLISELRHFNTDDPTIVKDIMRYKTGRQTR